MNTGDVIADGTERSWTVGQCLGAGLWGKTWIVRSDQGQERVLKIALRSSDFPKDAPIPDGLLDACNSSVREQAALLKQAEWSFLPRLEGELDVDGTPAFLMPRYVSLRSRLDSLSLGDSLELWQRVTIHLEALQGSRGCHGNLRPSNILINERGEPVLSDVLTPAAHDWWVRMDTLCKNRERFTPPEAAGAPFAGWDSWAICVALYQAAMHQPGSKAKPQAAPMQGLNKAQLATLKERMLSRLKSDKSNSRFAMRVGDKLASLLNRGITAQTMPSPPYRFENATALRPRLQEVESLVSPRIDNVGRLLLGRAAKDEVFHGDCLAQFSVTVGCSAHTAKHDDVACGIQIVDRDAEGDGRITIDGSRYSVKNHASGRMRFEFELPNLPPGRFRANIAFTVKDSGHAPVIATGDFEVRPPPGYVPPAQEEPEVAGAITFPGAHRAQPAPLTANDGSVSVASSVSIDDIAAGLAADADRMPMPIAPSQVPKPTPAPIAAVPSIGAAPPIKAMVPSIESADEGAGGTVRSDPGAPALATPTPSALPAPMRPSQVDMTVPATSALQGPGTWEELPVPEEPEPEALPYVPGLESNSTDLPTFSDQADEPVAFSLASQLNQVVEALKRDMQTAALVGMVGILSLVLAIIVLFKACL